MISVEEDIRFINSHLPILQKYAKNHQDSDDANVSALCVLIGFQVDLFKAVLKLDEQLGDEAVISMAIITRSILENAGTVRHVAANPKRSQAYLDYVKEVRLDITSYVEERKTRGRRKPWSSSTIEQRVRLLSPGSVTAYDFMSNFVYGNNVHFVTAVPAEVRYMTQVILLPNFADLMLNASRVLPLTDSQNDAIQAAILGLRGKMS